MKCLRRTLRRGWGRRSCYLCGIFTDEAESQASILMKRPDVRARIKELRQEAALLAGVVQWQKTWLIYRTTQQKPR